jgi:membrane protease YdiL (CAAX protease family)
MAEPGTAAAKDPASERLWQLLRQMRRWIAPGTDDGPLRPTIPLAWALLLVAVVIAINEMSLPDSIPALHHRLLGYAADQFILPTLGILFASILLRRFRGGIELTPRWSDIRWLPWAAVATAIQLNISLLAGLFTSRSGQPSPLPPDAPRLAMVLIATMITAPILEEVVWRGVLQPALIGAGVHPMPAILMTSATWAAAHFGHAGGYGLATVLGIAASGYVQGVIVYRTGRLAPAIAVHAGGNVLSLMTYAGFWVWTTSFGICLLVLAVQMVLIIHPTRRQHPCGT